MTHSVFILVSLADQVLLSNNKEVLKFGDNEILHAVDFVLFMNTLKARDNELRECIPVPHDNYLKFIISSHPCCEGYFYLLFPCKQSKIT